MDQLFDSLSEDWVSQPRSPHSSQAPPSPSAINSPSQLSNGSQSRIPRYQPRPSSRLSSGKPELQRRESSTSSTDIRKLPLTEKTSSTLNSINRQPRSKGSLKPNDSSPNSNKSPNQRAAKDSVRSVPQETVQHKPSQPSPVKAQPNHGTPDWKRRLRSNTGSGDQQDLFSPIKLESVFRPPTVKSKGEKRRGPRYQPSAVDDVPSSPPPLPLMRRKTSETLAEKDKQNTQMQGSGLDVVEDSVEEAAKAAGQGEDQVAEPPDQASGMGEDQSGPSSQTVPVHTRKSSGEAQRPLATPRLPSYSPRNRQMSETSQSSDKGRKSQMELGNCVPDDRSRVTSGQTADCNEDLSPFFVSRQHTVDGHVDYAPVVDMNQVRKRMGDLRHEQQDRPSSPSSDTGISYLHDHSPAISLGSELPGSDITSHSLPEDLSTGTQSFVANGGFINARRGGRSQEGSFLKRPLSPTSPPSAQTPVSERPPSPEQRSTKVSNERNRDSYQPTTPKRQPGHHPTSFERPRSSGSPLKLFDKYDTFTNDRLQRRMSKFEKSVPDSVDEHSEEEHSQGGDEQVALISSKPLPHKYSKSFSSRVSSFGEGELDRHGFDSFPSPPFTLKQQHSSGGHDNLDKDGQTVGKSRFIHSSNKRSKNDTYRHRGPSGNNGNDLRRSENAEAQAQLVEEDVTRTANGKRLPYSPAKDPTPKRRRTLRSSEEADLESLRTRKDSVSTVPSSSSILGRKRKDALYDNSFQVADPKVLAMRQMLRPRNPTPSQSASQSGQSRRDISGTIEMRSGRHSEPDITEHSEPELHSNPLTQRLAEGLANLAQDMAEGIPGSARKPSVNTADFFNEAQQIMQLIRSRGKPASEAIEEEEPTADLRDEYDDSLYPESTKEEFSRPPSREGGSLRRVREPIKLDARVVSQLRKFEEKTDVAMTLSSSLKSLKIGQPNDTAVTIELKDIARQQDEDLEGDSNIRIIERRRRNSSSATSVPVLTNDTQVQSNGSQSTSGPSTGQSVPSNSSRGSRNKAVIAPETVAHLLSDQVAGMTFDHERQVWVKSRSSSKADDRDNNGGGESEVTDDELGAIPDLSVDEMEEMQRIKLAGSPLKTMASVSNQVSIRDHAKSSQGRQPAVQPQIEPSSRPQTADGAQTNPDDTGSAPSKFSRFASSGPMPETRATSWGGDAFPPKQEQVLNRSQPLHHPQDNHAEEAEHEISILEGRLSSTPRRSNHHQPRVVTVTFSSPLVDQMEASYFQDDESVLRDDGNGLNLDDSPVCKVSNAQTPSTARRASSGLGRKSAYRSSSRRMSLMNQSYIARPMSRLDEQDEMSMVHIPNGGAMDLAISTPLPARNESLVGPPTGGNSSIVTFQLSPLPEFTVHQVDRPLDRANAAQPLLVCSSQQVERQVSQATQEIVKKITDVEPYEPYWDYLRLLDLHERNLASLHMLNEFCGQLEELDVSVNQLRELAGAPCTLRHLRVRHNCLTDLTAWNHLYNLQYLDVSGNQLQSLKGFQSLVHLRELRADDNQIEDIAGILELDGLIRLSLRGNCIASVDFDNSNLQRLTDLDMRGNKLIDACGLHQLQALEHLNLSNNELSRFSLSSLLPRLETLDISSNNITTIDLAACPSLRTLNLDNNSISYIHSLSTLRNLQTLSWRYQSLPQGTEIDYQSCHNITTLNLSGNALSTFAPQSPFFNIQVLELASTGLETLSEHFGLQCPNLRTLNLNYNALKDLRPLLGIARLEKLFLAGNRIQRLRRTAAVLDHIGKDLLEVDIRSNPLTVGFYTPQASASTNEERRIIVSDPIHTPSSSLSPSWASSSDSEAKAAAQTYLLPTSNRETDKAARERLDEDTKLRRRVYEMLLVSACHQLRVMDGLEVYREEVGRRDGVWERLIELGILRPKGEGEGRRMIEGVKKGEEGDGREGA